MIRLTYFLHSLVFLALCLSSANGQDADSLYRKYKKELSITDELERDSTALRNYADYVIFKVNDRDAQAELLLDSLEHITMNSSWNKASGILWGVQARYFESTGDMDQALQLYNLSIDTLRNLGPNYHPLAYALVGSGFAMVHSGLHEESISTFQEGYLYAQKAGDLKRQILILNFFGDFYYYSGYRQQKFDSALFYYEKTHELIENNGWRGYFKSDTEMGLANVHRRLGNLRQSEKYFQSAMEEARTYNNNGVIYALYVDKAEVYDEQKQYEKSLALKLEAYEYVKAKGFIEFIARADNHLYNTYKSLGRYEEALVHYEKYISAQDSMKKEQAQARYQELEAQYQSKEKEEEIYRLQNQNLEQTQDFLLALAIIGIILTAFISWVNWNLRKKNRELEKKNREILLAQLRGQSLERKRMAVELHDNLNTKIAAIRWQLEALSPSVDDKANKVLSKTLDLVNDVYGDVRLISHNLMPEKVEALGLIAALEGLLSQLKHNNKTQFHLLVNTGPEFSFGSLAYPIYNIVFEMINNILKHAEAENSWISVSTEEGKVLITVSDDGKGFDIDQNTSGYGLRNITSRLENIKGSWNIESAPGKGTKFYIEIPMID